MQIIDGQTTSDFFNGTAEKTWTDKLGDFFNSATAFIGDVIGNIKIGDVKLSDWERVTFAMSIYTKTFLRLPIKPFK